MEKESLFMNGTMPNPLNYTMEASLGEINCCSEQFFNLNRENPIDHTTAFESTLGSIVSSSPLAAVAVAASNSTVPADSNSIRELIGRLGSICSNGEIPPPHSAGVPSAGGSTPFIAANSNSNLSAENHRIMGMLPLMSIPVTSGFTAFAADPGFAERAAKFSCFDNKKFGGLNCQFSTLESPQLQYNSLQGSEKGKLFRVSSSNSAKIGPEAGTAVSRNSAIQDCLEAEMRSASVSVFGSERKLSRISRSSSPDYVEFSNACEETSVTDPNMKSPNDSSSRKRRGNSKGKEKELSLNAPSKDYKEAEDNNSGGKRFKTAERVQAVGNTAKARADEKQSPSSGGKNQGKDSSKLSEPPKDYIHVRARRGQATDSHSLAERVRREKISERMKFLQDLVPGCNKVTGKAVMLDEIINYVQSLQRQVEFLSMKLATVNTRLDFNMEAPLSKDILHSRGLLPQTVCPLNYPASVFPYGHQCQQGPLQSSASNGLETLNPLDATLQRSLGTQQPVIDVHATASSQHATLWEGDLQNVVHMGFTQNHEVAFPPQTFQGSLSTAHMKVEQ